MEKDKENLEKKLAELIMCGVYFTHNAHEYEISQKKNPTEIALKIVSGYHRWKIDVANFFYELGRMEEASFFIEADEVPMVWGGKKYRNIESSDFKILLRNIRKETRRKLLFLRDFKRTIIRATPTQNNPFAFFLSRSKGLYRFIMEGTEICPVHRNAEYFQMLTILKKSFQGTDTLSSKMRITQSVFRRRVISLRKKIAGCFDGVRGLDFIQGEQNRGYRLGERITLEKRD